MANGCRSGAHVYQAAWNHEDPYAVAVSKDTGEIVRQLFFLKDRYFA